MSSYFIWTIGCQMNKAESERLATALELHGFESADSIGNADIVILNGCVVRKSAENRVVNRLNLVRNLKKSRPDMKIAVTGCFVEPDISRLRQKYPFVDYFMKPGEKLPLLDADQGWPVTPASPDISTFVTIMQGCNNFCSYCIVPYRRGRERSRSIDAIYEEAKILVERGAKEIILLGQNVDSYGKDLPEQPDLADLLYKLNEIDGLLRLRFLTNHPKDMSTKLIKAVAALDRVCEQINVPVQAGNDGILEKMRRGYTSGRYRELVREIRETIPGVAISTDVIVGFPGETDGQYEDTYRLLEELRLDAVHVAAYSTRPGTIASREYPDSVPAEVKKERLQRIEVLQEKTSGEINASLHGTVVEVLVEREQKGKWMGRTRTDKPVFFEHSEALSGNLVPVRVKNTGAWSLSGELEPDLSD